MKKFKNHFIILLTAYLIYILFNLGIFFNEIYKPVLILIKQESAFPDMYINEIFGYCVGTLIHIISPLFQIVILLPFYKLINKIFNNKLNSYTKIIVGATFIPLTLPIALLFSFKMAELCRSCSHFYTSEIAPIYLFIFILPIAFIISLFVPKKYLCYKKEFCLFLCMNMFWACLALLLIVLILIIHR